MAHARRIGEKVIWIHIHGGKQYIGWASCTLEPQGNIVAARLYPRLRKRVAESPMHPIKYWSGQRTNELIVAQTFGVTYTESRILAEHDKKTFDTLLGWALQ